MRRLEYLGEEEASEARCDRAQLLAVTELPVLVMELHFCFIYSVYLWKLSTYDHRSVRTGHPVRSAIHKH
jgi:hypothetical protein